jgi:hypothetical protein
MDQRRMLRHPWTYPVKVNEVECPLERIKPISMAEVPVDR